MFLPDLLIATKIGCLCYQTLLSGLTAQQLQAVRPTGNEAAIVCMYRRQEALRAGEKREKGG